MCFIVENRKEKIAEKDIVCYKEMEHLEGLEFETPYRNTIYNFKKQKVYKVPKFTFDCYGDIKAGLHSYSTYEKIHGRK